MLEVTASWSFLAARSGQESVGPSAAALSPANSLVFLRSFRRYKSQFSVTARGAEIPCDAESCNARHECCCWLRASFRRYKSQFSVTARGAEIPCDAESCNARHECCWRLRASFRRYKSHIFGTATGRDLGAICLPIFTTSMPASGSPKIREPSKIRGGEMCWR